MKKRTETEHKIDFALFNVIKVDKYMAIVGYMITCFFTFKIALDRSQKWQRSKQCADEQSNKSVKDKDRIFTG